MLCKYILQRDLACQGRPIRRSGQVWRKKPPASPKQQQSEKVTRITRFDCLIVTDGYNGGSCPKRAVSILRQPLFPPNFSPNQSHAVEKTSQPQCNACRQSPNRPKHWFYGLSSRNGGVSEPLRPASAPSTSCLDFCCGGCTRRFPLTALQVDSSQKAAGYSKPKPLMAGQTWICARIYQKGCQAVTEKQGRVVKVLRPSPGR